MAFPIYDNVAGTVGDIAQRGADFIDRAVANPAQAIRNVAGDALSSVGSVVGNLGPALGGMLNPQSSSVGLPLPNALGIFASYNTIFTLSCLNDDEINFPDRNYRAGQISNIILKSGNGDPNNRINTAYGKFDFFMDDVEIDTFISPNMKSRNTNASQIKFKITEPYSMGLFLQSLQLAAKQQGYKNYLQAPFLLAIEFAGITEDNLTVPVPGGKKYIPLKFVDIGFNVAKSGSTYDCTAVPFNEQGFSSKYHNLQTDVAITGATVQEMLQSGDKSLQRVINSRNVELRKEGRVKVADEIAIIFPKEVASAGTGYDSDYYDYGDDSPATSNPSAPAANSVESALGLGRSKTNETLVQSESDVNLIGASSMGFDMYQGGQSPFGKEEATYDEKAGIFKRNTIAIDPKRREFKFTQGSDIQNAITQVILVSEYGRKVINPGAVDENGMLNWFRIESQVFLLPVADGMDPNTGDRPKLVVYRVIPYKVHSSKFTPPNVTPTGYENLKKNCVKEYNYIYTGKNVDVLDFDIRFDIAFARAAFSDAGANNMDARNQQQMNSSGGDKTAPKTTATGASTVGSSPETQLPVFKADTDLMGGGGSDTDETRVARLFNDAIVKGAGDMLQIDMKILGDPYYIADSGMGNYSSPDTQLVNLKADGSMNHQNREVHVLVKFRTPVDINDATGGYVFPENTQLVEPFSGLYKVITVKNSFSKGKFIQSLNMARLPHQEKLLQGEGRSLVLGMIDDATPDRIVNAIAGFLPSGFASAFGSLNAGISDAVRASQNLSNIGNSLGAGNSLNSLISPSSMSLIKDVAKIAVTGVAAVAAINALRKK